MGERLSWLAVGAGAAIGAWLRWGLGMWLTNVHAHLQAGTLAANLVGGYAVGIALGFFTAHPHINPEWRLFIVTGFLGGLTTFSSFSAEVVAMLQRGDHAWAAATAGAHLFGSLLMTAFGLAAVPLLARGTG